MSLFAGLARSDYQDVLRAVGRLVDAYQGRQVRLVEQKAGIILQLRHGDPAAEQRETYLLTDEDLTSLLRDAYRLRHQAAPAGGAQQSSIWPYGRRLTVAGGVDDQPRQESQPPAAPDQLTYQNIFRALGRLLDEERLCTFRIIDEPGGIYLQARRVEGLRDGFVGYRLGREKLQAMLREAAGLRGDERAGLARAG